MDASLKPDAVLRLQRADRRFFLIYLALIWFGIVAGFGSDIAGKFAAHTLTYPWIVHVHAVTFVGWLALLTAQILLIRGGRYALHRRLGPIAAALVPLMVVLGPATGLVMNALNYGHPKTSFPLLAAQFANTINFAVLTVAGLLMRRSSPDHKRLMIMGTIAITPPGFARLMNPPMMATFGPVPWVFATGTFGAAVALLLGIGVYDLALRGRLYRSYAWGLSMSLTMIGIAVWLYFQPWWAALTTRMAGH